MSPHLRAKDRAEAASARRRLMRDASRATALALAAAALATPAVAQVTQNLGGASVTMAMSGRRELVQPTDNTVWSGPRASRPAAASPARVYPQPAESNAQGGAPHRSLLHAHPNDAPSPRPAN